MSFIRPEARDVLSRWGESAVAGAIALFCLAAALRMVTGGAVFGWFAGVAGVLALLWLRSAVAKALAMRPGEAPGVVEVREREIRYFGPMTGGVVDLDALVRIEVFLPAKGFEPLWRLTSADGRALLVPVAAKGADRLMDAFEALPDFGDLQAAAALRRSDPGRHLVWQRPGALPQGAISGS